MTSSQLLRLIGEPSPAPEVWADKQDATDIMHGMIRKHKECFQYYDSIAMAFSSGTVPQICRRLYNFCKSNFSYKEEGIKNQYLSAPQTILKRGYSDCKGYALFIGGCLDAMRRQGIEINWFYRFASYKLFKNTPGHVFVVVVYEGSEIWIDPVLDAFDLKSPYWSAMDRHVNALAGVGYSYVNRRVEEKVSGLTASAGGVALMKLAPKLSAVPVAAIIVEAGGILLAFIGNKFNQSPNVRWLTQKYEYHVLGLNITSDNGVNENDVPSSQKWFSYVLGVPIGDQLHLHALWGTDYKTGKSRNRSLSQCADDYLTFDIAIRAGITHDQALQAVAIAHTLNDSAGKGAWKGALPAPSLIEKDSPPPPVPGAVAPAPVGSGDPTVINPLWFVAGAAALYFIIE